MNRYFTSFFIVLTIYATLAFGAFYVFKDNLKVLHKELEKTEKISLNQIHFTKPKELVEPVKKEQKKIIKKEIPKKKIIEKTKPIEKKLIQKKEPEKVVKETVSKQVDKSIEKVHKNIIKNEDKVSKTPQKKKPLVNDDKDLKKEYIDRNLALIISLIKQNITYPSIARKRNIQGVVEVKFSISQNGEVKNIEILSGHKFLRKATIKAIENASQNFPKAKKNVELKLPVSFTLI